MSESTIATIVVAFIGATGAIVVALIQTRREKSEQPIGIHLVNPLPSKKHLNLLAVILFVIAAGLLGFIGGLLVISKPSSNELPPTQTQTTQASQPLLISTSTPDKSGNSVSVGGDSGIIVQGDNNVVSPPTVVVTVNSQPEPTYNKWCVIAESGALFFDTPVLIPANMYAMFGLYPGTKIYVVDEVGVHYKISQAEFNLGDQVEDFGPFIINEVVAGMPAEKAGIKAGDIVISIDGIPVDNPIAFRDYTMNHLNQNMVLEIRRNNKILIFEVIPEVIQGAPRIGVVFSGGGKYTGIVKMDLPGYVPTYFVSCNPDIVNQNTTTKLPEGLFSLEEPATPTPSSSP